MANEILKTIKIDVNSSEYKALEKSLNTIKKYEAEINKLNQDNEDINKLRKKVLEDEIKRLKQKKDLTEAEKKLTQSELTLKQKETEKQLAILKINEKLVKLKKQAQIDEKRALAKEARDNISKNAGERARERQREKWSQGRESAFAMAQRYKGVGGLFNFLGDRAQKAGDIEVEGIDENIAQYEDTKKANEAQIESLETSAKRTKTGEIDKRSAEYKEIQKLQKENKQIDANIDTKKDQKAQSIGNTKTQVGKYAAMAQAAQKIAGQLNKIADTLLAPFKKLAQATMDAVKQMIDFKSGIATYNTQGTLITNSTAREQQMKYGLSSSQNWAFTQTKSMLGIETDEDLMYMNGAQRDKFLEYMERYSRWYDQLESSGVLADIQEMQLEFQELKNEIAMEFLQWVAENKEVIMACIRGIFEFIKAIADVIMNIMKILSRGKYSGEYAMESSDKGQVSMTSNQKNTTINVNANTTNNATGVLGSQEALDSFNKENFNKLAKQIATAIGG